MADDIDRRLVDKRVAQRYVKKGVLDEKEYEKYVKSLPDLADKAVPIESDLEPSGAPAGAPEAEDEEGAGEKEP